MEAGCGSVKAEASVSIAAGCDPMKVDGLVKMEAGFESARVEALVGSVKMDPHVERWWLLQETEVAGNRFRINVEEQWKESSKVEALLHHLQTLSEAGSKSVVFSQWTAFLDLLEIPLKRKNFCFVRLDGTLLQRQREQVLKSFSNIPAVVADSVEERMQQVQARKQRLIAGALTDEERALTATTQADDELGVDVSSPSGDLLLQFLKSGGGDEQLRSSSSYRTQQSQLTVPATALLLLEEEEKVLLHDHSTSQQQDLVGVERPFHPPVPYPFPNAPTFQPADNVVHPPHSSGELKARPALHFESPVFGPSAAETSDSKRAPEQPRRSVTPAKDDKQQFHGNGSELLQLLQGGPGRVKPTASTKVDATQDSGDSGEPSKKGSPSAVHGPIGLPRRHVVSPPQSPNDLLGRLWAALPASSHTSFDGESERKTSARSFGVEANEMSREVDGAKGIGACRLALPLNGYDYNDSKTNDKPRTNSASGRLQDYRGRYVNGEAEFEPGGDDFRGAGRRRGPGRADARRGGRGAVCQWIAVWRIKQADSKAAFPAEENPDYEVPKARSLASQLERPGLPSGSTQNSSVGAAFEESKQRLHNLDALEGEGVTTSLDLEELQIDGHRREGKAPQFYKPKENRFRESRRVIPMHRRDLLYRLDLQSGYFTRELFCLYDELIPTEEGEVRRRKFFSKLESLFEREVPGTRLFLFGSCVNAFGVCNSDIDVCLSVDQEEPNKIELVVQMATILESDAMLDVQEA
ncbi:hypothetical protein SELMODRAFT_430927 [Selaginella moellendorffii]|uniref:Uncharacterized protein n=1 Tax=Selaginella moellendorffii TaxID=88036 RepID=D8TAZ6_SELML|nr:hypothetical protein SELMODRAFT_430927 [Selaginella moellendorffii]